MTRYPGVPDPGTPTPTPLASRADSSVDNGAEGLIADIMVAVLSLEYGTVTVTVKGGQVVSLERSEKRRLARPAGPPPKPYAPRSTPHLKETL